MENIEIQKKLDLRKCGGARFFSTFQNTLLCFSRGIHTKIKIRVGKSSALNHTMCSSLYTSLIDFWQYKKKLRRLLHEWEGNSQKV